MQFVITYKLILDGKMLVEAPDKDTAKDSFFNDFDEAPFVDSAQKSSRIIKKIKVNSVAGEL